MESIVSAYQDTKGILTLPVIESSVAETTLSVKAMRLALMDNVLLHAIVV